MQPTATHGPCQLASLHHYQQVGSANGPEWNFERRCATTACARKYQIRLGRNELRRYSCTTGGLEHERFCATVTCTASRSRGATLASDLTGVIAITVKLVELPRRQRPQSAHPQQRGAGCRRCLTMRRISRRTSVGGRFERTARGCGFLSLHLSAGEAPSAAQALPSARDSAARQSSIMRAKASALNCSSARLPASLSAVNR